MSLDVFMWVVGILLGVIGSLLGILWAIVSRALDKIDGVLIRLDERLNAEFKERIKLDAETRDRARNEQAACLAGCTHEWERVDDKLDTLREDLKDCENTLAGFEAGLVQRSELKGILAEFVAAARK